MNGSQIIVYIVLAVVSTGLIVLFLPRAPRVLWFQIVLWIGTGVVAFLGALMAVATASELAVFRAITGITLQEIPLIPAALGALGGALVLNVPLLLLSRFDASQGEEAVIGDQEEEAVTSEND